MGFCATHDEQLFAPIEKAPLVLGKESAFLLSYRAICYEFLSKEAALRGVEIQRQIDIGKPFAVQSEIQQVLHFRREGIKRGIRDLNVWKSKYDAACLSGNYDSFSFYGVKFSSALPIVSCGAFLPEFDFTGNSLQIITQGEMGFEHVCLNLTLVGEKSVAVFGWTGEPNGPSECFLESFKTLPQSTMANAVFHVACEYLENTYLRPSWWNAQTPAAKEYLVRRFRSGTGLGGIERKHDCFSQLTYSFANAAVEQESSS